MKRITIKFVFLIAAFTALMVIFNGCNVDHSLSQQEFARIYMPQARDNPAEHSLIFGFDTTQAFVYAAAFGGPGKQNSSIPISFSVNPSLVDSFNNKNLTSYVLLPKDSYELSGEKATIPAGKKSTDSLLIKIDGTANLQAVTYLLPITMKVDGGNIKINKKLQTTYFVFQAHHVIIPSVKPSGEGTKADPYKVKSVRNLKWVSTNPDSWDAVFKQTQNIDASKVKQLNLGKGLATIGNATTFFNGTYDGQGHTITGIYINLPDQQQVGFFGKTDKDAVIKDVHLKEVDITGNHNTGALVGMLYGKVVNSEVSNGQVNGTEDNTGGLVGSSHGSINGSEANVVVKNNKDGAHIGGLAGFSAAGATIEDSHATGNVTGTGKEVGGLVGDSHSTINNSYATGDVQNNGDQFGGGLVGINYGQIENSHATGDVTGFGQEGGLVGDTHADIINCYATGDVHANGNANGGLVGYAPGDVKIKGSFATGDITGSSSFNGGLVGDLHGTITNSYATGDVTGGNGSKNGGLVGWLTAGGGVTNSYSTGTSDGNISGGLLGDVGKISSIENNYWDKEASGLSSGYGADPAGGVTGLKTSEMQGSAAQTNMTGFDFSKTWQVQAGGYPTLQNNPPPK